MPIKVGYNRSHAILMVCVGILLVVLGVLTVSITRRPTIATYSPIVSGGICALVGVLMRTRPLLVLEGDRIVLLPLLGPLRRTFRFSALSEVRIADDRVMVGPKKLPIRRSRCDAGDWARFTAAVHFE